LSRLVASLRRITGLLRALRLPFAVVGGLGVSVRVEPRFTRVVDLCVAVAHHPQAEALVRSLRSDLVTPYKKVC
jgi:hypothetical protein